MRNERGGAHLVFTAVRINTKETNPFKLEFVIDSCLFDCLFHKSIRDYSQRILLGKNTKHVSVLLRKRRCLWERGGRGEGEGT